jgi:hypothetical protein
MSRAWILGCVAPVALIAGVAGAQPLTTSLVASGLSRPVYVTAPAGDFSRAFIVEQRAGGATTSVGRIRIVQTSTNTLLATPYMSTPVVAVGSEQGLLGMAFHPQYMSNGYFYINYTRLSDWATVIARYRATGGDPTSNTADPATEQVVMTIAQPQNNHNGGWMAFGPDGYLYIASGDGGNGNDTGTGHTSGTGNAQDITANPLGKILRIDVDGADNIPGNADDNGPDGPYTIPSTNPFVGVTGDDQIWFYGLRNPWRNSFDRETGDFWIADVGQDFWEEVNVVDNQTGGLNFGWRCMEGIACTLLTGCTCDAPTLTDPILVYGHASVVPPVNATGCSITGGYVYRGCAIPRLRGTYFFSDYCAGDIWTFRRCNGQVTGFQDRTVEMDPPGTLTIGNVTSCGEDAAGEMYICDFSGGEVFKIVAASPTPNCTVAVCGSADFDGDGDVGTDADIEAFFRCLGGDCCASGGSADFDGDGDVGTDADIEAFFRVLGGGGC